MEYKKETSVSVSTEVVEDEFDEEELQSVLKSELDDAKDFIDQLGDERAESTDCLLYTSPSPRDDR